MPEAGGLQKRAQSLSEVLRSQLPSVINNLPQEDQRAAKRLLTGAYSCITRDPRAMQAALSNPDQLRLQLIVAAQMGWTVGPTMNSDAHMLTYKGQLMCVPNYRGLVRVAYQGGVKSISTGAVREGDEFDYSLGTDPFIKHKLGETEDGDVTHAWCVIEIADGGRIVEVMTKAQLDKVRAASKGPVWGSWYEEQARKTVLKRALKKAPRSERLAKALAVEDAADTGTFVQEADFDILETDDVHQDDGAGTAGTRPSGDHDGEWPHGG
jgi:phage RecT family recombinase